LETGIVPIYRKFLQNNYLFSLEFKEGHVFGRVIRRRICHYRPYPLIDKAGNAVVLSPSSHQTEIRLADPRNPADEILYLDSATNAGYAWIMHGSIGVKPPQIRMYPRFPEGKDIPGKFPNLSPIRPSSGDSFGYVSYDVSPYEEPTDYVEYVIPPLTHIGFEFYNEDPERSHQPVLNILFAVYWFQVLKPEEPAHARLIGKIARREVPAAFLTVGFGETPMELGGPVMEAWNAKPLSLDEASELGR